MLDKLLESPLVERLKTSALDNAKKGLAWSKTRQATILGTSVTTFILLVGVHYAITSYLDVSYHNGLSGAGRHYATMEAEWDETLSGESGGTSIESAMQTIVSQNRNVSAIQPQQPEAFSAPLWNELRNTDNN